MTKKLLFLILVCAALMLGGCSHGSSDAANDIHGPPPGPQPAAGTSK